MTHRLDSFSVRTSVVALVAMATIATAVACSKSSPSQNSEPAVSKIASEPSAKVVSVDTPAGECPALNGIYNDPESNVAKQAIFVSSSNGVASIALQGAIFVLDGKPHLFTKEKATQYTATCAAGVLSMEFSPALPVTDASAPRTNVKISLEKIFDDGDFKLTVAENSGVKNSILSPVMKFPAPSKHVASECPALAGQFASEGEVATILMRTEGDSVTYVVRNEDIVADGKIHMNQNQDFYMASCSQGRMTAVSAAGVLMFERTAPATLNGIIKKPDGTAETKELFQMFQKPAVEPAAVGPAPANDPTTKAPLAAPKEPSSEPGAPAPSHQPADETDKY